MPVPCLLLYSIPSALSCEPSCPVFIALLFVIETGSYLFVPAASGWHEQEQDEVNEQRAEGEGSWEEGPGS